MDLLLVVLLVRAQKRDPRVQTELTMSPVEAEGQEQKRDEGANPRDWGDEDE